MLDLTAGTVAEILGASSRSINPVYENSRGPVNIKVVDPLNVPKENNFEFKLYGLTSSATWKLKNLTTGETINSDKTISTSNEQIINGQPSGSMSYSIPTWGISVNVSYTVDPLTISPIPSVKGGFLEATIEYSDNTKQWLTGMADEEGTTYANWIRSGSAVLSPAIFNDVSGVSADVNQDYENILGKTWAPYRLCSTGLGGVSTDSASYPSKVYVKAAPAWPTNITLNKIANLASVDVIIDYSHPELWTRCPVLEECDDRTLSVGNARKLMMRNQASVGKNGSTVFGASDNNDFPTGMGWFPGYAINLETGERLNMAFGEDSWLVTENGNDMKWNPSSRKYADNGDPLFGGKHYIYIFGHNGDAVYPSTDAQIPYGLKDIPRYDKGDGGTAAVSALFATFVV